MDALVLVNVDPDILASFHLNENSEKRFSRFGVKIPAPANHIQHLWVGLRARPERPSCSRIAAARLQTVAGSLSRRPEVVTAAD